MSAHDNLSPSQFPHYEVGGYDGAHYTDEDKVDTSAFGLQARGPLQHIDYSPGAPQVSSVPVASLRAVQGHVYAPHVRNLASLPAHVLEADERSLPSVFTSPEGTHSISDGTHRAAAALLRGDQHLRVRIEGSAR